MDLLKLLNKTIVPIEESVEDVPADQPIGSLLDVDPRSLHYKSLVDELAFIRKTDPRLYKKIMSLN